MTYTKELLSIVSNITELILQNRTFYNQNSPHHLHQIQNDLSLLSKQQNPSTQFIQFLINKPSYGVRNKVENHIKKQGSNEFVIYLQFIVNDKINSVAQAAQIWKISINKTQEKNIKKEQCCHQLIYLINIIISKLLADNYFNKMLGDKNNGKKYVFDYKINIHQKNRQFQKQQFLQFGYLSQTKASINNNHEIELCYLQRRQQNSNIKRNISNNTIDHQQNNYKPSQDTSLGDSNDSNRRVHRQRYYSTQLNSSLFNIYDEELELMIVGSQNDQNKQQNDNKNENNKQQQYYFQQIDSFQLLIDDTKSQDQLFIEQSQILFKNWDKLSQTLFS